MTSEQNTMALIRLLEACAELIARADSGFNIEDQAEALHHAADGVAFQAFGAHYFSRLLKDAERALLHSKGRVG